MFLLTSILKYGGPGRSPLVMSWKVMEDSRQNMGKTRNMLNLAEALNFHILWFEFKCLFTPLSRL